MDNICLTSYGLALKEASEYLIARKGKTFKIDLEIAKKNRKAGKEKFSHIHQLVQNKPNIILIAPGPLSENTKKQINFYQKQDNFLICGVQFSNFHYDLEIDIQLSTHALPLMASLHSFNKPKNIVHGVYSETPPVLKNSCTVCWSDPFLTKDLFQNGQVTAKRFIEINRKYLYEETSYITVPRNVMMFAAFCLTFLGGKQLILAGFDPETPTYFFSENDSLKLDIIRALSLTDPMIAAWDGRNERIPPPLETLFRQSSFIQDVAHAKPVSGTASGWRFTELVRGTKLLKLVTKKIETKLFYIGESKFCSNLKINKFE